MLGCDIAPTGDIFNDVKKKGMGDFALFEMGVAAVGLDGKKQFPVPRPNGMELVFLVVVIGLVGSGGARRAKKQGRDIFAVNDSVRRGAAARKRRERGEEIHGRGQFVARRPGGNRARLPNNGGHAKGSFRRGVASSVKG